MPRFMTAFSVLKWLACACVVTLGATGQRLANLRYCKPTGSPYHLNVPADSRSPSFYEEELSCTEWKQSLAPKLRALDEKICQHAAQHMPTHKDTEIRQQVMGDLIRALRIGAANLTVFGSSCNGFGLKGASDLDVYLYTKEGTPELSRVISGRLRRSSEFHVLREKTGTKYSIKLNHIRKGMQVELSVFDQRFPDKVQPDSCTALLRSYTHLDPRVKILGIFLKLLVNKSKLRVPNVKDLNSLAYLIMLIHYLQQTDPPILPVLGAESPYTMNGPKNNASLGELWLGFLRYYVQEYEWKTNVVSIRHRHYVTRGEKGWMGHGLLAIEHPFDTTMDLGSKLTPQMSLYILNVFNRWLTYYITDYYDGLVNHNRIHIEDHPIYEWRGPWLLNEYARRNCENVSIVE